MKKTKKNEERRMGKKEGKITEESKGSKNHGTNKFIKSGINKARGLSFSL